MFFDTLKFSNPPENISPALKAIWHCQKGEPDLAHDIVQFLNDHIGCKIHAYIHRLEGDHGNARYWYNRASSHFPDKSLKDELEILTDEVLSAETR